MEMSKNSTNAARNHDRADVRFPYDHPESHADKSYESMLNVKELILWSTKIQELDTDC